jgi:phosphoglycerate kinase
MGVFENLDGAVSNGEKPMAVLSDCKTAIMNGPMGVFDFEKFNKGTLGIVDILADTKDGTITIIGGGDSDAACEHSGRASEMSHISIAFGMATHCY